MCTVRCNILRPTSWSESAVCLVTSVCHLLERSYKHCVCVCVCVCVCALDCLYCFNLLLYLVSRFHLLRFPGHWIASYHMQSGVRKSRKLRRITWIDNVRHCLSPQEHSVSLLDAIAFYRRHNGPVRRLSDSAGQPLCVESWPPAPTSNSHTRKGYIWWTFAGYLYYHSGFLGDRLVMDWPAVG